MKFIRNMPYLLIRFQIILLVGIWGMQAWGDDQKEKTVSPLICGANAQFNMAGLYYGMLPELAKDSRREEFKKLLSNTGIHLLRFPGGTCANSCFLEGNGEVMRNVLGAKSYPERDPYKFPTTWQFLQFCRETGITPIYQVNMTLFSDGKNVYQIAGTKGKTAWVKNHKIIYDVGKRKEAIASLMQFAKKIAEKKYNVQWELGNEEYSCYDANDYADIAIEYIKAIRSADPDAMIWVTLGANFVSKSSKKIIPQWSRQVLQRLKTAGLAGDSHLGFTLHYVWPEYIYFYTHMLKKFGFKPRLAVTEFHMAGAGPYWDLSPRYGYALGLADFLISMTVIPSVEIMCIHDLVSQNFGIFHYNQKSYGRPDMGTWDESLGYQAMPSAYVYEMFSQLLGDKIIEDVTNSTRLVVESKEGRKIFFINNSVNPLTLHLGRNVIGNANRYKGKTLVPALQRKIRKKETGVSAEALGQSNQSLDPLRADRVYIPKCKGEILDGKLLITVPSYSVNLIQCYN